MHKSRKSRQSKGILTEAGSCFILRLIRVLFETFNTLIFFRQLNVISGKVIWYLHPQNEGEKDTVLPEFGERWQFTVFRNGKTNRRNFSWLCENKFLNFVIENIIPNEQMDNFAWKYYISCWKLMFHILMSSGMSSITYFDYESFASRKKYCVDFLV